MVEEISRYDDRGNLIHYKHSDGFEYWREFDENNNRNYYKNSNGCELWFKWEDGERIEITQQEFKQIKRNKRQKEFLSREPVSRFELMEI